MVGDALVFSERLQHALNLFFDKVEATCANACGPRPGSRWRRPPHGAGAGARRGANCDLIRGRLQRYARSGFVACPRSTWSATLALLL